MPAQPVLSPLPTAGDEGAALPSQAQTAEPQPTCIPQAPQRWANRTARPNTSLPPQQEKLQLKVSRCRQQPWNHFRQHKLSSFWGNRGSLPHPPHHRPARLSAPGQPGAHAGTPTLPSHLPPMQQKSLSSPSPAPRGALGTGRAGTMLAAQQPGSWLGAGAKAKQEQPWRPGRKDGLGWQRERRCLHKPLALSSSGGH